MLCTGTYVFVSARRDGREHLEMKTLKFNSHGSIHIYDMIDDDESIIAREDAEAYDTVARDVDALHRGKKRERAHERSIEDAIFANFGQYGFKRQKRFFVTVRTLLRDVLNEKKDLKEEFLPLPPELENVYLCSNKQKNRIVDLCAYVGDTLFMIECDENGHRGYDQEDESERMCDIWEACECKPMVLVRINPTLKGVSTETKTNALVREVALQIEKIEKRTMRCDRYRYVEIKLFYPDVDVRVERLVDIPVDIVNKHMTPNGELPESSVRDPNGRRFPEMSTEKLNYYNDAYLMVFSGSTQVVYEPKKNRYISYGAFKKYYLYDNASVDGCVVNWAELWLQSKRARRVGEVVFAPGQPRLFEEKPTYDSVKQTCDYEKKKYNLWNGFSVEPDATKDFTPFLELLRDGICSSDDALYEYVLDWMAFGIQHPSQKCDVALVMGGRQQTGKLTVAETYGRLFGDHFMHARKQKGWLTTSKLNLHRCKMLFLNEATFGENGKDTELIRNLMRNESHVLERSFRNKNTVHNVLHVMIASNDTLPLPESVRGSRFVRVSSSDKFKENHAFFDHAYKVMFEEEGIRGLLDFLQKRDISTFNSR